VLIVRGYIGHTISVEIALGGFAGDLGRLAVCFLGGCKGIVKTICDRRLTMNRIVRRLHLAESDIFECSSGQLQL